MNNKVKQNMLWNLCRNVFSTFIPLIVFKYVTLVLDKGGLGKISFSQSIIQYILLIAGLGISTYAVRECSKIKDDDDSLQELASELFSINIISTFFSYLVLIIILLLVKNLEDYRIIIVIQSLTVFFTTMGVEWVTIVFEDFKYITIRTILIQLFTLGAIFFLVKSPLDIYKYVWLTTCTTIATNVINFIYCKKYISFKLIFSEKLLRHLKPILLIFFVNVAIGIYVNSDLTIIGYLRGNIEAANYSIAVKIYSVSKAIISSLMAVTIPNLANKYYKSRIEYNNGLKTILSVTILIVLPLACGVFLIPEFAINIISSSQYYDSVSAVKILMISIIPTMISTVLNNNVLIIQGQESKVLLSTCVSSILNIVLNLIFIPYYGFVAAAYTTLISELLVVVICTIQSRITLKEIRAYSLFFDLIKSLVGCFYIVSIYIVLKWLFNDSMCFYLLFISLSIIGYFYVELKLVNKGMIALLPPNSKFYK